VLAELVRGVLDEWAPAGRSSGAVPIWIVALAAAAICAIAVILQGDALGVPWWLALIVLVVPLVVVAVLAAMRGGDDTKIL
jgi:hypothetical protein